MHDEITIWEGVPETRQTVEYIVDEPTGNDFSVVCDQDVAGFSVIDLLYKILGIWRITIDDQDEDEEVMSMVLTVTVDRRFDVSSVRASVLKLLENLYKYDLEDTGVEDRIE